MYSFDFVCLFKENECFDISLIHDTRTGSEASLPRVKYSIKRRHIDFLILFRVLMNVNKSILVHSMYHLHPNG